MATRQRSANTATTPKAAQAAAKPPISAAPVKPIVMPVGNKGPLIAPVAPPVSAASQTSPSPFIDAAEPHVRRERKAATTTDVPVGAIIANAGKPTESRVLQDDHEIEVDVPTPFNLTDDDHELHRYGKGRQKMKASHADHPYAVANGVKKV